LASFVCGLVSRCYIKNNRYAI